MIIVSLSGGLGNQMFQFATGYALSQRTNQRLILETSELLKDTKRKYALGVFNIKKLCLNTNPQELSFLKKLSLGLFRKIDDIKERTEFKLDSRFSHLSGNCRLIGYWQNQSYFENYKEHLIYLFSLRNTSVEFSALSLKYVEQNTVSIHVRRGDYVSELHTNQIHGTCSIEYYKQAIELISNINPLIEYTYLIFSDDKVWSEEAFSFLGNKKVIENLSDSEELILMSKCKHNIIANSSFSWWAAWLNKNKNKIVIAPIKWFAKELHDTSDLIPNNWYRI